MILPIYLYGQPVLKKVAEDITAGYPNLQELIANMFDTMHHAQGIGLAAPQIGILRRVVVIDVDDENGLIELINPEIIEATGSEIGVEGCLSIIATARG